MNLQWKAGAKPRSASAPPAKRPPAKRAASGARKPAAKGAKGPVRGRLSREGLTPFVDVLSSDILDRGVEWCDRELDLGV